MSRRQLSLLPDMQNLEAEGRALSETEIARLRALVDQRGADTVAADLHVSRATVVRALAKLALQRGTVVLLRGGLAGKAP